MKKVGNFFKKIHELWKIPKYKGLIQLGFWFLFFTVVLISIHMANSTNKMAVDEEKNNNEQLQNEITSYTYNYQINDGTSIVNIDGTYYNGEEVFNYNNARYYYKDNLYYLINNLNTPVSFDYWMNEYKYNNIIDLVNKLDYESKTEYKDGRLEYSYVIDSGTYNNYYQKNYQTDGNVVIKIIKKDEIILTVTIDFSSYLLNYNYYQVIINYSNVNNIKGLGMNIE